MEHRNPQPAPSIAGRAALAVALTVCFYTLAIAVGGALVVGPVLLLLDGHVNWLTLFGPITGLGILWSIVPRPAHFEPPGPLVTADDHPDLVAEIERVAKDAGHPMPDEIYLAGDVNAAVTEVGPFWRRRRVLIVGLPLLQVLTVSQLRAVMAHEFAHYIGGDTRFGNWIWRTRAAIGRTLIHLHDEGLSLRAIVSKPFEWYGILFSRITAAVSRRQEFAADALAARVAGADANKEALRRIHRVAPAHAAYLEEEVSSVLSAGFMPPLADGFRRFMSTERVREQADTAYKAELEKEGDPHDSHPTLSERLAAIDALDSGPAEEPPDPRPALELIPDVPADEAATLRAMAEGVDWDALKPIAWDDVLEKALRPIYAEAAGKHASAFEDETVGGAADLAVRLIKQDQEAVFALMAAVTLALEREGFTLEAPPGEAVRAIREDDEFVPFLELADVVNEETTAQAWRERCVDAGVAGVDLAA